MILFFDTETTGKADFRAGPEAPHQPRIVQLAAIPPDQLFCTMKSSTPICQIPSPHFPGEFKWPKLIEAHQHAFGTTFDGAHDALADVRACAKVYFWLTNPQK